MYRIKDNWVIKRFADEIILFNLIDEKKYYLDKNASNILCEAISNINFKDHIAAKYDDSERNRILNDIDEFLNNLLSLGVL